MPSTSSRGGAPMRRWLPLAVGSGLLLAGCTESRGPTQPAVRGSPYFNINTTYFDGSNTHINNVVNYTQYWASNTNLPPTDYSPLSDDAIIAQIEAGFSSGALTFDPSTLYIVFTGIGVNPGGGFGAVYCAYHGFYIAADGRDPESTRLNSSHPLISYSAFCL